MSKSFKLSLSKVTCITEQFSEPGQDEMYLVGFGISSGGKRFAIPPRSMGSYGSGEVSGTAGFPKVLIDAAVPDLENLVVVCFWLFEHDSADLPSKGAVLESVFNNHLSQNLANSGGLGLDAKAHHLYAFAQTMLSMRTVLGTYAYDWWNNDDVMGHHFHHLKSSLLQPGPGGALSFEITLGPDGLYTLRFEYELDMVLVATE